MEEGGNVFAQETPDVDYGLQMYRSNYCVNQYSN
jgi:hypothetical protein